MEVKKKYIAVDELQAALNAEVEDVVATYTDYEECGFSRDALNEIIENIQTEDVAPVVYAKWKLHNNGNGTCSGCNHPQTDVWDVDRYQRYCGVCGAKMSLIE